MSEMTLQQIKERLYAKNDPSLTPIDIEAKAPLVYEILRLKARHNVVLLGHNYMEPLVFNLSSPEKSLILLAPLASEAGGYNLCKERNEDESFGQTITVFADPNDPDYQKILAMCRDGYEHLEKIKRFDMPGFRPTQSYIREMKRYGLLPNNLAEDAIIDVYETDQAYWCSLWWQPIISAGIQLSAP